MTTSILTLPAAFIRLASSGYAGAVLILILRLDSSVEPDWAIPEAPEKTSATVAATAHFLHRLNLIDTTPHRNGRSRVREGTWDATAERRRMNRIGPGRAPVSDRRTESYGRIRK